MVRLIKSNKNSTNAKKKKPGILRVLTAPARCIKRKVVTIYKELVKKEPKKLIMKFIMKKI